MESHFVIPGLMFTLGSIKKKSKTYVAPLVDVLNNENLRKRCKNLAKNYELTLECWDADGYRPAKGIWSDPAVVWHYLIISFLLLKIFA